MGKEKPDHGGQLIRRLIKHQGRKDPMEEGWAWNKPLQ